MASYFKDNVDLQYYFEQGIDWDSLLQIGERAFGEDEAFSSKLQQLYIGHATTPDIAHGGQQAALATGVVDGILAESDDPKLGSETRFWIRNAACRASPGARALSRARRASMPLPARPDLHHRSRLLKDLRHQDRLRRLHVKLV